MNVASRVIVHVDSEPITEKYGERLVDTYRARALSTAAELSGYGVKIALSHSLRICGFELAHRIYQQKEKNAPQILADLFFSDDRDFVMGANILNDSVIAGASVNERIRPEYLINMRRALVRAEVITTPCALSSLMSRSMHFKSSDCRGPEVHSLPLIAEGPRVMRKYFVIPAGPLMRYGNMTKALEWIFADVSEVLSVRI